MPKCIYCQEYFNPTSNRQKTCRKKNCKKKLHNERIKRHREKNKEQNNILWINTYIAMYQWPTLVDIAKKTKINGATTYYHLKKQMKIGRIRQIKERYALLEQYKSQYIFFLDTIKIQIQPHHEIPYYFCRYIEDEGLSYEDDENGNKIIKYKNLGKAIDICYRAYACVWAQLLSQKMYDQFRMRYAEKTENAIGFFLHGFNRLSTSILSPKNPRQWYGPAFPQSLTVDHINNKIDSINDVSHFLKRIHGAIKKELEKAHPEYDELSELLNELLRYSEDKFTCKSIYLALKKTIDVHGEPLLPIEHTNFNKNQNVGL